MFSIFLGVGCFFLLFLDFILCACVTNEHRIEEKVSCLLHSTQFFVKWELIRRFATTEHELHDILLEIQKMKKMKMHLDIYVFECLLLQTMHKNWFRNIWWKALKWNEMTQMYSKYVFAQDVFDLCKLEISNSQPWRGREKKNMRFPHALRVWHLCRNMLMTISASFTSGFSCLYFYYHLSNSSSCSVSKSFW